jgi:hypothetical protein
MGWICILLKPRLGISGIELVWWKDEFNRVPVQGRYERSRLAYPLDSSSKPRHAVTRPALVEAKRGLNHSRYCSVDTEIGNKTTSACNLHRIKMQICDESHQLESEIGTKQEGMRKSSGESKSIQGLDC